MLTLLHYMPHIIFAGLGMLALVAMFSDDGRKKRAFPERARRQHYVWDDHNPHAARRRAQRYLSEKSTRVGLPLSLMPSAETLGASRNTRSAGTLLVSTRESFTACAR